MKAIILAGGLGTRLRPFTEVIPKPLLPIGEKSILEIQIEHLKSNGFDEIFIATNYKSEYIESFLGDGSKYGVKLIFSREENPLGTAGPLKLLQDQLTEPFIVLNGDILTKLNYLEFYNFAQHVKAQLTITVKEIITPFQFGNIFFDGDYVTGIQEKPEIKTKIMAGIYVFQPEVLDLIPKDEYYGMDKLIIKMLNSKLPVAKYEIKDYWLDIGRMDDFEQAQDMYNKHFKDSE